MSEDSHTSPNRVLGCSLKFLVTLFLLPFLFMFTTTGAGSGQLQAGFSLLFGWMSFLTRTLPQISWNADLIMMGVLCVALILGLAHISLRWLTKHFGASRNQNWTWRWRWTCCGTFAIALLFLVGMAVGGAAHQIGWIASSEEPWYELRGRYMKYMVDLNGMELEITSALSETNTITGVYQLLWDSNGERRWRDNGKQSLLQSYHILWVSTNLQTVDGVITFPRDPQAKSLIGGVYISTHNYERIPAAKLPALLKEQEAHLIAF